MKSKFTAQQRLKILQEVLEKKRTTSQVCQEHGISRTIFYRWLRRFQDESLGLVEERLKDQKRAALHFSKSVPGWLEREILRIVHTHPDYSLDRILAILPESAEVGRHGIQRVLERFDLSTWQKRVQYANRRSRSNPKFRERMIQRVVKGGESVSAVCRDYQISRPAYYIWLERYRTNGIDGLWDCIPKEYIHPRKALPGQEQAVMDVVVQHPEFSVSKIVGQLPIVEGRPALGHHGVQNVLERNNLNTYLKRVAHSQRLQSAVTTVRPAVSWQERLKQVTEEFLPGVAPAPPAFRYFAQTAYSAVSQIGNFGGQVALLFRRFAPYFFLSFLLLVGLFQWGRLIGSAANSAQMFGLLFASLSLGAGTIFFLYSLKYYFTLAVVLSFSRESNEEGVMSNEKRTEANGKWTMENGKYPLKGWLGRLFGISRFYTSEVKEVPTSEVRGIAGGLEPDLTKVELDRHPFISVHLPLYNEKRVAERLLRACTGFEYPNYEVVAADDSTDETTDIVEKFLQAHGTTQERTGKHGNRILKLYPSDPGAPALTLIHRADRAGFKGGALKEALKHTDPRAEFIVVFDADFVPYPDTLELFLKYFSASANPLRSGFEGQGAPADKQVNANPLDPKNYTLSPIAAIQGYQWHVLNKSENWITRGVRSEYAGSYVIERSGAELYGGLKQIAGSVYMIRRDLLDTFGWGASITEDFQLTLKLYEAGYKVVYTPYIQAPAECASTLKRLIRQRMRWAEGHSFNIRKMFMRLLFGGWGESAGEADRVNNEVRRMNNGLNSHDSSFPSTVRYGAGMIHDSKDSQKQGRVWRSSPLSLSEKLEFLYLSPYYLQAAFFLIGTIGWLVSEAVFKARLPFWTAVWGWSLVLTNLISLPLMNAVGLFLEEAEERDFYGIFSFFSLTYLLAPFQAYASIKGFLEKEEGPWFRTPKTGNVTDIFTRGRFYRFIRGIFTGKPATALRTSAGGISNEYLSLATANTRFDHFFVRRRRKRRLGRLIAALVVFFALMVNSLGFFVPQIKADAPGGEWWDSNYQYRQKITVTTGANSPSGGYSGYTVRFTIDTATDDVKFLDTCNDLRITRWNGSGWDELPRHVINDDCNDAATDVRFTLAADISASSSDTNYYVYYGYASAGAPTALSTTNVYLWWDDATSDRLSSYTLGRCDAWHGTGYTAWSYDATNDDYNVDTGDNFTGCFRQVINERDAYIESEFSHTGCYNNDLSSGLIGRFILASGTGGTEDASHYYSAQRADSSGCSTGYATDGDIVEGSRTGTAIDGTDPAALSLPTGWRKMGMALWGINNTNGKYWDSNTVSGFGPAGWPTISTNASGSDSTDQEGAGDWGIIAAQDVINVRNIMIRRYTEAEPSIGLSAEEVVPEAVILLLPLAIMMPSIVRNIFLNRISPLKKRMALNA